MKKIFFLYKGYYKKSILLISLYIVLSLLTYGIIIAFPLVFARIIDAAVYFVAMNYFLKSVGVALLLLICHAIIIPLKHYIEYKIEADSSTSLREIMITRIPVLQHEAHNNTTIGHLLQLIDSDLSNTESLVVAEFVQFLNQTIYFIAVFIIVMKININLSFVLLGITLPMVIISKIMIPYIQKSYQEYIEKNEEVKNMTDKVFNGTLVIKLANSYEYVNSKVKTLLFETREILMKYNKYTIFHYHFLTGSFMNVGQFIITALGAYMIIRGSITIGTITIIGGYFGGLWGTFDFFISFWKNYKEKMISVNRIVDFLQLPYESKDGVDVENIETIELKEINYTINNTNILENISMTIDRGAKILLTGDNGSGKSTLVRLFVGLMSPTTGSILLNKKELSLYKLYSLRDRINYIPADPYIFAGSLEDNFFGDEVSSDFIDIEKYNNIDTEGSNLSSGEKKRLQLAVGMVRNCDLYILDEPLNFVDEATKKDIVDFIKREFKDKTLIIISHESEPFDFCEHKYFMEKGRIQKL